jgi:hypothetical protein
MKEDKMDGCCSMHVRDEKCIFDSCDRSENQNAL